MTPAETRLFLAELRAARPSALRRLTVALKAANGNVSDAAAALGLRHRARIYAVAESQPAVRAIVDRHGMGRPGATKLALLARSSTK